MKTRKIMFTGVAISLLIMVSCNSEDTQTSTNSQDDNKVALSSEFLTLKSGTIVENRGNQYVWQDDILLSKAQYSQLDETGDIIPAPNTQESIDSSKMIKVGVASGYQLLPYNSKVKSTAIYPTAYNMWAMVRFTYAKDGTGTTLNSYSKYLVQQALAYWEANTNVRFYNATDQPTVDPTYGFAYPYVNFCDGSNNQSYVGRVGGRQDLTLVPYGASVGTVIHEIGHAIGLLHEQCRYDRDNYITVNTSNIQSQYSSNFTKRTTNYYCIGSFDFNSIMLYPSYTGFEIDYNVPSMTKKDGTTFTAQRTGLSDLDKRFPNTFYLPYIARSDTYQELANVVYKGDNTTMTAEERLALQAQLNNGNSTPPAGGRIPNNF